MHLTRSYILLALSLGLCLACVADTVRLETTRQVMDAARGQGVYENTAPGTVFVLADGRYSTDELDCLLWIRKGGTQAKPSVFRGESRDGVVIVGRCSLAADHVVVENMTFDLTGHHQAPPASYSTVAVQGVDHVTLRNLSCRGDGMHGLKGGHIGIEQVGRHGVPENIVVEDCVLEKFGLFDNPNGRFGHGIAISSGRHIRLHGNTIRDCSGHGVQFYPGAARATIRDVVIRDNRILDNGHVPRSDGIRFGSRKATQKPTISRVVVRNNLLAGNAAAGIRFATEGLDDIEISRNTFLRNGDDFMRGGEAVFDAGLTIKRVTLRRNLFVTAKVALQGWRNTSDIVFEKNYIDGNPGSRTAMTRGNMAGKATFQNENRGEVKTLDPPMQQIGYTP